MIKTVLFDFGGVVCSIKGMAMSDDILGVISNCQADEKEKRSLFRAYAEKLGTGEITESDFWHLLCEKLKVSIPGNHNGLWRKGLVDHAVLHQNVFDFAVCLRKAGYLVCVLSNTVEPHAAALRSMGWFDAFDRVFLSNEIGLRKPDEAIYRYVVKELGIKPQEILFIDDLAENLEPAKKMGMITILAGSSEQVIRDIQDTIGFIASR